MQASLRTRVANRGGAALAMALPAGFAASQFDRSLGIALLGHVNAYSLARQGNGSIVDGSEIDGGYECGGVDLAGPALKDDDGMSYFTSA